MNAPYIHTNLFINDGAGTFTLKTSQNIPKVYDGDVVFGDYNMDSFKDMVLFGRFKSEPNVSAALYLNNQAGDFINFGYNTVSHLKGARKNFLLNAYEPACLWYGIDDFE